MLNIDLNSPEYLELFIEEVNEIIDRLESNLINYEDNKSEELNKSLKRDFHTLKGDFSTYGEKKYSEYFHELETNWQISENRTEKMISNILTELSEIRKDLNGFSGIKEEGIEESEKNEDLEWEKLSEKILEEKNQTIEEIVKEEKEKESVVQMEVEKGMFEVILDFKGESVEDFYIEDLKEKLLLNEEILDCIILNDAIPSFEEIDPEKMHLKIKLVLNTGDFETTKETIKDFVSKEYIQYKKIEKYNKETVKETEKKIIKPKNQEIKKSEVLVKEDSKISKNVESLKQTKKETATIRVNTVKLDNLVNIVGELIVAHSSLRIFKESISEDKIEGFEKVLSDLDNITKSMQEDVLSVRMIAIGNTFLQFKRMIRDMSKKLGKKVNFEIKGGETEIDKTIIEKIVDPLRHMIRNSIDHGIETKEDRLKAGKNETGAIKIQAYHQGGEVIIEISDDGGGLDKDKLLAKAIANNVISSSQNLSEEDIYALIFEAGFSTKEKVTEISGRGVGMDVVKNNIEELSGKVEIESKLGEYTKFKIRLPLTLAIIDGMLVKVGDNIYAIPILTIVESLQPKPESIKKVQGKDDILEIRGAYYPLVKLHKLFGIEGAIEDPTKATSLIVETYKGKLAIMVDDVVDNQQIVIKKLNLNHKEVNKFSGATILGSGEVALILDIKMIYDSVFKKGLGGEINE